MPSPRNANIDTPLFPCPGVPHGHTGHVRFLTAVETTEPAGSRHHHHRSLRCSRDSGATSASGGCLDGWPEGIAHTGRRLPPAGHQRWRWLRGLPQRRTERGRRPRRQHQPPLAVASVMTTRSRGSRLWELNMTQGRGEWPLGAPQLTHLFILRVCGLK
ncbi:hypothetical protein MTO96_002057 [Rhipicephalus appendiculatus]